MEKIVIRGRPEICARHEQQFREAGLEVLRCHSKGDLAQAAKGAKIVMCYGGGITGEVMENFDASVKWIIQMFVGLDNYDVDAATRKGIGVCNNPNYGTEEVAAMAISLFLTIMRKTALYDRQIKAGKWPHGKENTIPYSGRRLSTMTFGIVGFGAIGRQCAKFAKGLGMNVVACSPHCPDQVFAEYGVRRVSMEELYALSDAISLHTPLRADNRRLIGREAFAQMKDGVFFINTARGALVDEEALIEALNSGKVAAAGLDVFGEEPLPKDSPLLKMDNVVLTPHAAYHTAESEEDIENLSAEIVLQIMRGEVPASCVNKKQLGLS